MTKWEYKVVTMLFKPSNPYDDLNALGAQGWELTSMIPAGPNTLLYFKRPLSSEQNVSSFGDF